MPSRLRVLIKQYPPSINGYVVYKGADAIRFIQQNASANIKLTRPFNAENIYAAYITFRNAIKKEGILELELWQIGRGAKNTRYGAAIQNARSAMVWDKKAGCFILKNCKIADKKKKESFFIRYMNGLGARVQQAAAQFAPAQPARVRPNNPEDWRFIADNLIDDIPEPRDR